MNTPSVQTLSPVLSNDAVLPDVRLLWLEAPEIAGIAQPGQFVMIRCAGGTLLRRPLSIFRQSADKTRLAFLMAVVGRGTAWLAEIEPGDLLDLRGPLGNGFSVSPGTKNAVLVAGGLGVAPLGFLADELAALGVRATFLYGAASSRLLCPDHILPKGAEYVFATDDGSRGRQGFITSYLPEYLIEETSLFACGPTPMYRALTRLDALRDRETQVSLEIRMACGLGVCYGCTVNTRQGLKQVCKHGPVFMLHDVLWDELADI